VVFVSGATVAQRKKLRLSDKSAQLSDNSCQIMQFFVLQQIIYFKKRFMALYTRRWIYLNARIFTISLFLRVNYTL
jgi:hypothetical protein